MSKIVNTPEINGLGTGLLQSVKMGMPTAGFLTMLKELPAGEIKSQLDNDDKKKAFWINIYNAFTQIILLKNPGRYKDRQSFFPDKQIEIAGITLSLDDIEHGILRRSKVKWSLGYINKPFPSAFEKNNRVEQLDHRIHFALNCGAKGCPAILFYEDHNINAQLGKAEKAYLESEVSYNEDENIVILPAIMQWFKADFGGTLGVFSMLRKYKLMPGDKVPGIKYKEYNWELFLQNYR